MAKEPWEEELYEEVEGAEDKPKKAKSSKVISTPVLTALLGIFFAIVLAIFVVVLYTSSGGGSKDATDGFYGASTSSVAASSSSSEATSSTTQESSTTEESSEASSTSSKKKKKSSSSSSSSTEATTEASSEEYVDPYADQATGAYTASSTNSTGATISVNVGEGAASIAARAGISLEQLYALNPNMMTGPGGTWYANPGDLVNVN